MTTSWKEFLGAISLDADQWQFLDIRVFAVRVDGSWENLVTQVWLRSGSIEETPKLAHPARYDDLRGEQFVLPIAKLPSLFDQLSAGWLELGEERIHYRRRVNVNGPAEPYRVGSFGFRSLDDQAPYEDSPWSGHSLRTFGDSANGLIFAAKGGYVALQELARQHSQPLQSLDHLGTYVTNSKMSLTGEVSRFDIFAPFEVRLEPEYTTVADQAVHFRLIAGSLQAVKGARLQVVVQPPGKPPAKSIIDAGKWKAGTTSAWTYTDSIETGAVDTVDLALHCGSRSVQWLTRASYRIDKEALQLRAYRALDPHLEVLKEWLGGGTSGDKPLVKGDAAAQFEEAVARLFTLSGWQVDAFRHKRLSNAVDLLAYNLIDGIVLAVECTIGPPDGDKLAKLVNRVADLRRNLVGVRVLGVLASPRPRETLAAATITAMKKDGLAVLHSDSLSALLHEVQMGSGMTRTWALIKRLT